MILIMGGGLSGSLLAYRINQLCPNIELYLVESQPHLSTEPTWSFHETDLATESLDWIKPFISQSWNQQEVYFDSQSKILQTGYHSIRSHEFASTITTKLQKHLILGDPVTSITPSGEVILASGRRFNPRTIFDARGLNLTQPLSCGYQRFLGLDVELSHPHGLTHPIIMDTRCAQDEGFKFIYTLPWTENSLLIEATCYANEAHFDEVRYQQEVELYCYQNHWKIKKTLRTEKASLPIPLQPQNSLITRKENSENIIQIGLSGGYFHFTTGYSLPLAVQVSEVIAHEIATQPNWSTQSIQNALTPLLKLTSHQSRFFSALNRMLFLACPPEQRVNIFRRFYTFKQDLIERFYRGELSASDQIRILLGKPPVPLISGLKHALHSNTTHCSWEKGPPA